MDYDNYKLSLEDNEPYVSQCCGSEAYEVYDSKYEEYKTICDECNSYCDILLDFEYQQIRSEQIADEMYEENKLNN